MAERTFTFWRVVALALPVGSRKRPGFAIETTFGDPVCSVPDEEHATLIAAAPRMLDALRIAEARLAEHDHDPGHVEACRALGLVRLAIATALGKPS